MKKLGAYNPQYSRIHIRNPRMQVDENRRYWSFAHVNLVDSGFGFSSLVRGFGLRLFILQPSSS